MENDDSLYVMPGDRAVTYDGKVVVVIDKRQRKFSRSYWCNGLTKKQFQARMSSRNWEVATWLAEPRVGAPTPSGIQRFLSDVWPEGYYAVCLLEELDERENEFGTVMP